MDYSKRYKTVYFKSEEELERFKKEQGDKSVSEVLNELIKDGYKYRRRIASGDWIKKEK